MYCEKCSQYSTLQRLHVPQVASYLEYEYEHQLSIHPKNLTQIPFQLRCAQHDSSWRPSPSFQLPIALAPIWLILHWLLQPDD